MLGIQALIPDFLERMAGINQEALMRFEVRVITPSIARTVTLIKKASEMERADRGGSFNRIE